MDDATRRLVRCFTAVFPSVTAEKAPSASQDTLAEWDSVNMVSLLNVIQEEFGVEVDYEQLEQLTSFERIRQYILECPRG